ncbi:MAG: hypothetical protein JSV25_02970, partial [Spirochaetota bacterium]
DIGFSFEYPADYQEEPTQTPIEIARFAKPNEFKLPVFTATVRDSLGTKLTDLPERITRSMEETIPNTSNFNIINEKSVKLSDGSEAIIFSFTWVWADGETVMETVMISAYKGDKQITISGTTIEGLDIPLKKISKYCMTLSLTL